MSGVAARAAVLVAAVGLVAGACIGGVSVSPSAAGPSSAAPSAIPSAAVSPTATGIAIATPAPSASPPVATGFDPSHVNLGLVRVNSALASPVFATGSGDGSGRLFVVEQTGRIRVIGPDGKLAAEAFLDLHAKVSCCGERGLLGLAFSPTYVQDGRFFVDYTDAAGNTVVSAFVRHDADHADAASERILLHVQQPFANHNGGMIAFGPDGDLYVALGDGGSGGDPQGNGQRLDTLLGKLLRLDVTTAPYTLPADNPFVGRGGVRPEIFEYGLRNPWRFSFDRQTGDLFIGDVGQNAWEEIDVVHAGAPGGLDFGWNIMEGDSCYAASACHRTGLTLPVYTYSHAFGCAVVGGYVYRGATYPALAGAYLFSDDCSGRIWAMNAASALKGPATAKVVLDSGLQVSSFGQDDAGELYLCDLAGGTLYRITADAH